jgi:hypothetical protein
LLFLGPDPEELLEKRQWQDALHGAARPVPIRRYSSNPIDPVI